MDLDDVFNFLYALGICSESGLWLVKLMYLILPHIRHACII